MNTARRMNVFVIIGMLAVLAACANVKSKKRLSNLEQSITSYEVALRWAQYESAYSYHVSPEGVQPPVDLSALNKINVTGIDVLKRLVNKEQNEAYVSMRIKYYKEDEGTVHTLQHEINWWYSEENKQWFIDSDFPKFN